MSKLEIKHCPECGTTKSTSSFYKNKARRDGLQSICKVCLRARNKKWYDNNTEYHNTWMRNHSKSNRGMYNARDARRKAAELRATPSWADLDQIRRVYELRQKVSEKTGITHHVDHIIPLQGKYVCGLHVENNLAIVPAKMNLSKGNRYGDGSSKDSKEDEKEVGENAGADK